MLALIRNLAFIMLTSFIVGGIPIFSVYAENPVNGVVVSTDKLEYQQGEVISIILKNNFRKSVFSHIRSLTPVFCIKNIEKKITDEQWKKLYAQCQFPNCTYEIDPPGEIKSGESVTLEWNPLVFVDGAAKTALPDLGMYRLAISYQECQKEKWQFVYTNTFAIN